MNNVLGDKILRFIILLIFGLITIGYSISIINDHQIAGIIGIGIGVIMILFGLYQKK